jgi:molecular chaperone DnaK (HSP70)
MLRRTAIEAGKNKPNLLVDKIKRVVGKTYEEAKEDPLLANIAYELIPGKVVCEKTAEQTKEQHEALVRVGQTVKREYLPEEIVAKIFLEAKKHAESYLRDVEGYSLPIDYDRIVITFPANFNVIHVAESATPQLKLASKMKNSNSLTNPQQPPSTRSTKVKYPMAHKNQSTKFWS